MPLPCRRMSPPLCQVNKVVGSPIEKLASRKGSQVMSSRINRAGLVALAIFALVGCQSGPRWAWWKHDTSPENASLVARAAPMLPSTQSVPLSATAAATPAATAPPSANSIAGAMPPSANSLAAAGIGPASIPIPSTSPASMGGPLSGAPNAYPSAALSGMSTATSPMPPSATMAASTLAPSPTSAMGAGPYDPNGYRPASATTAASAAAVPISVSAPDTDRYGVMPPSSGAEPDRYTMVPDAPLTAGARPNANMSAGEHYGNAIGAPSAGPPAAAPVATAPISAGGEPDRYGMTPAASQPAAALSAPSSAAPPAAATVCISSPAGQYRPGGTTTYAGLPASGVEIASRPTTGSASATPAAAAPTGSTLMPSSTPGIDAGTRY
jgi:hypothetical protein